LPVELIDQLLAHVQNKDAESILGESGLAGQFRKMRAERMLAAELTHHLANEEETSKNHRNGTSPKKVPAFKIVNHRKHTINATSTKWR
jgi:transposase-like protein